MGEADYCHMKWLQLVRQPYFSNGSHARAGSGFLVADLRALAAVRVICAFSSALRATTNSADDLRTDVVFVPLNDRGTKLG